MNKKITIIIISYNRAQKTLESIHNVLFEVDDIDGFEKELIVINNGSSTNYAEVEKYVKECEVPINYIDNGENLGVSGGRNLGLKSATGDYVFFIDDDAVFEKPDVFSVVHDRFSNNQNLAVIGFAVVNFYNGEKDYPVKDKSRWVEDEFFNNVFWGGACAIRRSVFDEIGTFDTSFFYGMEEYDFAYRAMNKDFKILFTKRVVVLHKVEPAGRETDLVKFSRLFVNKCIVAYRYLPMKFLLTHIFMWSIFLIVKSKGNLVNYIKSLKTYFTKTKTNNRTVISKSALKYIKSVSGRLSY